MSGARERGQGSRNRRAKRHEEEIKQMMAYLEDIGKLVTNHNANLLTVADLLGSFEKWQSNFEKMEITLSWKDKRPTFMCPPVTQKADECWAIALSRAISILLLITGSSISPPTVMELRNNVHARHLSRTGGIDRFEDALPYLTEHYLKKMTVHRRPSLEVADEAKHEKFEKCIVKLLAKGPLAIAFESLPSFSTHDWKTIFVPTYEDCQARANERLCRHCALLTGIGVEIRDGVATEFWEVHESGGEDYGHGGFVRYARHHCIIKSVCELEALDS